MTPSGTIKDDCIITKVTEEEFYVVINAGCKKTDLQHIDKLIADEFGGKDVRYETYDDVNSLIAIQGPKAAQSLGVLLGGDASMFKAMEFMTSWNAHKYAGVNLVISRLGYTGEDGFEVAVPNTKIN